MYPLKQRKKAEEHLCKIVVKQDFKVGDCSKLKRLKKKKINFESNFFASIFLYVLGLF